MTRSNDPNASPGQPIPLRPDAGDRTNPDASANRDAPGDRERATSDIDGTAADVPDAGAARGASNAGRTRTSGGDA